MHWRTIHRRDGPGEGLRRSVIMSIRYPIMHFLSSTYILEKCGNYFIDWLSVSSPLYGS